MSRRVRSPHDPPSIVSSLLAGFGVQHVLLRLAGFDYDVVRDRFHAREAFFVACAWIACSASVIVFWRLFSAWRTSRMDGREGDV